MKRILNIGGDEQLMTLLGRRLASLSRAEAVARTETAVMEADSAQDGLCNNDKSEYMKEKKATTDKKNDQGAFVEKVRVRRQRVVSARAEAAAKSAKAKRRKKGAEPPRMRLPPGAITQPEAKLMSPSASFIWGNTSSQAWCGKMPPGSQVSRSWLCHGHRGAAVQVLRELWARAVSYGHCDEVGVEGLFEEAALQEAYRPGISNASGSSCSAKRS